MFKIRKKPPRARNLQVWLLGGNHSNADKSIGWDGKFPNLSDPDVLVVDLTTLTAETLARVDKEKLDYAQKALRGKLLHNGTIIVISQPELWPKEAPTSRSETPELGGLYTYSSHHILPASLATEKVSEGGRITVESDHDFKEYMDGVQGFNFYIKRYYPKINFQHGEFERVTLRKVLNKGVKDNSGNDLGYTLVVAVPSDGVGYMPAKNTGQLVFLPPYTEPAEDAIGKILSVYTKVSTGSDAPPSWAANIPFDPLPKIEAQLRKLEEEKKGVQERINALAGQKNELEGHFRLLYSSGFGLESAVVDALRILGFAEAKRMGGGDSADVVFDTSTGNYLHAVVEVKGAAKRTGLDHLLQCNKWADWQSDMDGRPAKGIFVPNQYRGRDYPGSQNNRCKFEPNELDYAKKKDICVIPSCVLFEAVTRVLGGGRADRRTIEAKIADTRGVLNDAL